MIRPKRGFIPSLEWRRFKSSGRPPPAARRPQQQQQQQKQQQKGSPSSNNPAPAPAPPTGRSTSKEYKPAAATKRKQTTGPEKPSQGDTLLAVWKTSWLPLSGAAVLAGFLGFYVVGTATASFCGGPPACPGSAAPDGDEVPTGRPPALTGDNAEQFDKELDWGEWWMGITKLRRRLAERARGDVLEVAMGSGRNLEYYNWDALTAAVDAVAAANNESGEGEDEKGKKKRARRAPGGITSFTGLDISVDMLDVARRKLTRAVPPMASSAPVVSASTMGDNTGGQLSYLGSHLRLVHSDAHRALPPTATANTASKKYDTVVQTFGLCSVSDPVAVLSNIASAVKPDTGRVILLEHGKGWFGIVNGLLDRHAGRHFQKYGCWWNRDIRSLVEAAAERTPGLEIVKIERPNISQMGTLVWVELKVSGSQE